MARKGKNSIKRKGKRAGGSHGSSTSNSRGPQRSQSSRRGGGPKPSSNCNRSRNRRDEQQRPKEPKVDQRSARRMQGLEMAPTELYPTARSMERKLFLVSGPTNSGKTYTALKRFEQQENGTYLGPLRLLALEVRDTLMERGMPTNLVTGELIEEVEDAKYTAATIEMLDLEKPVDMIIIDEIQMLADEQRGSVWLQAVLGAPAKEVWMLGAPESEEAVQHLADHLGEELEIIRTERLSPLEISENFCTLEELPKGAAIVAFSRRDVLGLAAELKDKYDRTAAVIYGALSPEVRREQARLFREGEVDLLVATDAIGMGLNLPINEMYFVTSTKYNGKGMENIPHDLVWQIAGRAGRYGMHEKGIVSALNPNTLKFVQEQMDVRPAPIPKKFNFGPSWPVIRQVAERIKSQKLTEILTTFNATLPVADKTLFNTSVEQERVLVAQSLDAFWQLDLRTKSSLLNAPIPVTKEGVDPVIDRICEHIGNHHPCHFDHYPRPDVTKNLSLEQAEYSTRLVTLYCWLHYRNPNIFPGLEAAKAELVTLNEIVTTKLSKVPQRRCAQCGEKLAWEHRFNICDPCHFDRRY